MQQTTSEKTGESIKKMFQKNKSLIHVDLSHNGLTDMDIDQIAEGLKENHSILGLHMLGNSR